MTVVLVCSLVAVVSEAAAAPAPAIAPPPAAEERQATVTVDRTFVYEQPSRLANVVRRVYVGEVLRVVDEVQTEDGARWVMVALGQAVHGYVDASRMTPTPRVKTVQYRPERIIREELPLAVGAKIAGETYGAGLTVRYQPFSRLGVVMGVAGLIVADGARPGAEALVSTGKLRGTELSLGVNSFLVLWNLSPVIEVGLSRLSYDRLNANLTILNVYATAGIEWMFNRGVFLGAHLTFTRSLSMKVSFDLDDTRAGPMTVPDFGELDADGESVYQTVQPGFIVGYAF